MLFRSESRNKRFSKLINKNSSDFSLLESSMSSFKIEKEKKKIVSCPLQENSAINMLLAGEEKSVEENLSHKREEVVNNVENSKSGGKVVPTIEELFKTYEESCSPPPPFKKEPEKFHFKKIKMIKRVSKKSKVPSETESQVENQGETNPKSERDGYYNGTEEGKMMRGQNTEEKMGILTQTNHSHQDNPSQTQSPQLATPKIN